MKNVGILTWYKTINHGAVLQAYSTSEVLKSFGYNPVMLDYSRNMEKRLASKRRITIKKIVDKLFVSSFNKKKKIFFDTFVKEYIPVGDFYHNQQNLDSVVIGSDMVFEYFQGYNPFMYGKDVKCDNIISYAASFGKHTPEEVTKSVYNEEIKEYLLKMKKIGCRDENTFNVVKTLTGRSDMSMNIDPVLLYGFEKEKQEWNISNPKKKYIAVYAYHSTMNDPNEYKYIKKYAKEKGYEIVSIGYYHSWVDRCVNAGPKEFFSLLMNAECVFTDTFHGTVFSIILNKPFVSYIRENAFKLRYLLCQLNLKDRIIENKNDNISEKIENVNFEQCNKILDELRRESLNYLKENV